MGASGPARGRCLPTLLSAGDARPRAIRSGPLWPGARHTHEDRARAIRRGLAFIYRLATAEKNFAAYGDDFLWCFYTLSATTADPWLKRTA